MNRQADVIVIGAGFGGINALWKLRGMGFDTLVLERGGEVGGTWYWNRYPGCRCDVPSMEYSVPWDPELDQQWDWTERYSGQSEILEYAKHLADRHDLRRDIIFNRTVTGICRDEGRGLWQVETDAGETYEARYVVTAAGCLSTPNLPDITGIRDFRGEMYHTGEWPHDHVTLAGKEVAVLGTGSTGVQASTAIAGEAGHLFVLQRTAQYSLPSLNRPLREEEKAEMKARYPEHRAWQRNSFAGQQMDPPAGMKAFDDPKKRRLEVYERAWRAGRQDLIACYADIGVDADVNAEVAEFARAKIRSIVNDPAIAEKLCPTANPIGTRRIIMDTGYFEIFNQDNVSLVDISEDPIDRFVENGVQLRSGRLIELDMLVIATGYDAVTGPLLAMNITGTGRVRLADVWRDGPRSYLGLMVKDFPNLFTITGPTSPTVHANVIFAIDQHVDWIADCLDYLQRNDIASIEPTDEAQDEWLAHVAEVGSRGLRASDTNNWYLGQNIPGKPRAFMTYAGGLNNYRARCDAVAQDGYRGFMLTRAEQDAVVE
ncbi:NAD(P)/FAD-dependent oxidoreductase [Sphingobium sp. AS12]|uniref:flavin-containing monooxygenase n=1 Tax=Sphingobium sp. AS12 TaxID=2849495 RepID=UPI001C31ADE5|nr:NAD(P)/FAD-dependent oxidoreductase [Sphingobium sp. AS12]MBV2148111.1 NAD(P)/FAD-dependent oxidoreductase [Sphingobium sp. AS12]